MTMVVIRRIETCLEREVCYSVRMEVFVNEQKVPPSEELDEFDETAEHFAVIVDEIVVGTARLVDKGDGIGKIGRVAILRSHRRMGLGKMLVDAVIRSALGRFRSLILDSQLYVIPFYESFGFTAEGDVFPDAGIEHRKMTLNLDHPTT